MINTTTHKYIDVSYTLVVRRGIYQVILNYYDENHKRKQPWRSLYIEDKPR